MHWSSWRCPIKIRPSPTESALQLPNTTYFQKPRGYEIWMRLCSFIHTYLLRNVRIFFLNLISDATSIMNFPWNMQLTNVFPSKTLSVNNKCIFILHNKWVWMKEHTLIHSSFCHVEFHRKLSDKSVNKRDHSENYQPVITNTHVHVCLYVQNAREHWISFLFSSFIA